MVRKGGGEGRVDGAVSCPIRKTADLSVRGKENTNLNLGRGKKVVKKKEIESRVHIAVSCLIFKTADLSVKANRSSHIFGHEKRKEGGKGKRGLRPCTGCSKLIELKACEFQSLTEKKFCGWGIGGRCKLVRKRGGESRVQSAMSSLTLKTADCSA